MRNLQINTFYSEPETVISSASFPDTFQIDLIILKKKKFSKNNDLRSHQAQPANSHFWPILSKREDNNDNRNRQLFFVFFFPNYTQSTKHSPVIEVLDKNLHDLHSVPRFATIFLDYYGQVFYVRFSSLPFSQL